MAKATDKQKQEEAVSSPVITVAPDTKQIFAEKLKKHGLNAVNESGVVMVYAKEDEYHADVMEVVETLVKKYGYDSSYGVKGGLVDRDHTMQRKKPAPVKTEQRDIEEKSPIKEEKEPVTIKETDSPAPVKKRGRPQKTSENKEEPSSVVAEEKPADTSKPEVKKKRFSWKGLD